MVSALDAGTGQPVYQQVGDVVVARIGPTLDVVATNSLTDQSFVASPAVAGGNLFLRSRTQLFRISDRGAK